MPVPHELSPAVPVHLAPTERAAFVTLEAPVQRALEAHAASAAVTCLGLRFLTFLALARALADPGAAAARLAVALGAMAEDADVAEAAAVLVRYHGTRVGGAPGLRGGGVWALTLQVRGWGSFLGSERERGESERERGERGEREGRERERERGERERERGERGERGGGVAGRMVAAWRALWLPGTLSQCVWECE
jgi:hypothetical protein